MFRISGKIFFLSMMICTLFLVGASQTFSKQNNDELMMQKIRQHIEKNMSWPVDQTRIEFLSQLPLMENSGGKISCHIESRPREAYLGDTSFNIRLFKNGIFLKEESIRVRIEVQREFVISTNHLSRDAVITESDVTLKTRWVREIPFNSVLSLNDVLGKQATSAIRPNTDITRTMFKEVMPVKKGKLVQVLLDNGAMMMVMNALAEEDGAEGSMIKVRNLGSHKTIYARVIGPGKVQVDF
jgi:flagella basal body P-ring formation protein FlgA